MGISKITIDDRASIGRGRIWKSFACQSIGNWRLDGFDNSRGENSQGRCLRFRIGGFTLRISTPKGGPTSECYSSPGSLYFSRWTCLSHHRICRVRFIEVRKIGCWCKIDNSPDLKIMQIPNINFTQSKIIFLFAFKLNSMELLRNIIIFSIHSISSPCLHWSSFFIHYLQYSLKWFSFKKPIHFVIETINF